MNEVNARRERCKKCMKAISQRFSYALLSSHFPITLGSCPRLRNAAQQRQTGFPPLSPRLLFRSDVNLIGALATQRRNPRAGECITVMHSSSRVRNTSISFLSYSGKLSFRFSAYDFCLHIYTEWVILYIFTLYRNLVLIFLYYNSIASIESH